MTIFPLSFFGPYPMTATNALLRRHNLAPLVLVNLGVGLHATIWYMATTAMPSAVE